MRLWSYVINLIVRQGLWTSHAGGVMGWMGSVDFLSLYGGFEEVQFAHSIDKTGQRSSQGVELGSSRNVHLKIFECCNESTNCQRGRSCKGRNGVANTIYGGKISSESVFALSLLRDYNILDIWTRVSRDDASRQF